MDIYEMTNTPWKRNKLENLSDENKLKLLMKLTDSKTFIDILEYIEQSEDDARFCQTYR